MRIEALQPLEGGITRIREKGGPNPRWLYDLLNGWVDQDGAIQSRPGCTDEKLLPAGTRGLCSVNGWLVVFSHEVKSPMPAGVTLEVLPHPVTPTLSIKRIHFAEPFLGNDTGNFLYVVVEYSNGDVYHFWTRTAQAWEASTTYKLGEIVQPTVKNGFLYRAHRLNQPAVKWAPNVLRTVGDKVEPTKFSGYEHTVTQTIGSNPRSGATEPAPWAEENGGITIEDTGAGVPTTPPTGDPDPPPDTDTGGGGTGTDDRYGGGIGTEQEK